MILKQNEIEINPIQVWHQGLIKTLDVFLLEQYSGYDFNENAGRVIYRIGKYGEATNEHGELVSAISWIVAGPIDLPYSLVENWGNDDTPIFEYVAQQLNLILI